MCSNSLMCMQLLHGPESLPVATQYMHIHNCLGLMAGERPGDDL